MVRSDRQAAEGDTQAAEGDTQAAEGDTQAAEGDTQAKARDRQEAEERARELRAEIRHHDYLYHVKNAPEISDEAYDRLYAELQALEERHPEIRTADSPTLRVGGAPLDEFATVQHAAPMLSLDSGTGEPGLRRFDERVRKALGDEVAYVVEPKLDGASVELVYEAGELVNGATRGDGARGEGILENLRTIPAVPLRLRGEERSVPPYLALRGEVIMRIGAFEGLNERLLAEGRPPFANPRNAAAGSLRQLDPAVTAGRPLDLFVYEILAAEGAGPRTHRAVLEALGQWGFRVNELIRPVSSVEEVLAYHAELEARRDQLDYEIDGVVVKVDDLAAREELGVTSHHPRWAYAHKFLPRKETSRVLRIVLSVGRTGVVTPVALLRPVDIGGVTVSRASLHNREEVARKDVREGDEVRVQRAGDVIPQVVERIEEPGRERPLAFRMPDRCPSCGAELVDRGPYTMCPNSFECRAQLAGRLRHFGSRAALEIEGLGEETAYLLVDEGLVRHLPQLFDLRADQLVGLEGFARKSADNLVEAIRRSADGVELSRFLYGLGIPEVGSAVARDLARHFGSFEALRRADEEALQGVEGVGPKMAEAVAGFFREPRNAAILDRLLEKVTLVEPGARKGSTTATGEAGQVGEEAAPLAGLRFVFTGELQRFARRDAEERVASLGGRTTSSVSARTDYVVAGPGAGSKLEKARKLGVEVLDEEGFLELLRAKDVEV
ncbi:MAG: NAD-dependent DNA ligase LigA [Gemmatimonadota bacterium]